MLIFKNIPLGTYFPVNSLLHRLQARAKLLLFLWFIICLTVANQHQWHFLPYVIVVLLVCTGIALSGISPRQFWQRMWLLVLFSIIGGISVLLYPETNAQPLSTFSPLQFSFAQVYWAVLAYSVLLALYILVSRLPIPALRNVRRQRWFRYSGILLLVITTSILANLWLIHITSATLLIGPIVITYDSIWLLVSAFTFFLVLYTLSLLLTMTTTPVALIEGMTLLMTPLRWLRLPVDDFALMTLLALRFIPTLIEEVQQLIKAQTSRGADLTHGTLRERLQSLTALFVPFLQGTLRRAAELATALEARGYAVEGRQTPLHETAFAAVDYVVLGTVVLVTVGALLV